MSLCQTRSRPEPRVPLNNRQSRLQLLLIKHHTPQYYLGRMGGARFTEFPSSPSLVLFGMDRKESRDVGVSSSRASTLFGPGGKVPRTPRILSLSLFLVRQSPLVDEDVHGVPVVSPSLPSMGPFQSSSSVPDPGSNSSTPRGPRLSTFADSSISQTSFYIEEIVPVLSIRVQTGEPANFMEPDAERNRPLSPPRPSGMQTHTAENTPPILSPSPLRQSEQLGVMLSKDDVASSKDASAKDSIITVPLSTSPKTSAMYQLGLVGHSWTGDTHLSSLPSTPTSSFSDWNSIGISGDAHGQRMDTEYVAETLFPADTGSVPETVSTSVSSDTIGEEQPGTAPHAPLPPVASQSVIGASSEASCITPRLGSASHPAMEPRNTAAIWGVGCEVVGEKEPPDRTHPPITTPPGSAPWRKGCAPRKTSFGMLYQNSTPGSSIPASQSTTSYHPETTSGHRITPTSSGSPAPAFTLPLDQILPALQVPPSQGGTRTQPAPERTRPQSPPIGSPSHQLRALCLTGAWIRDHSTEMKSCMRRSKSSATMNQQKNFGA